MKYQKGDIKIEFILFLIFITISVIVIIINSSLLHSVYKNTTGHDIYEYNRMIDECEKNLPRNKHCKINVTLEVE